MASRITSGPIPSPASAASLNVFDMGAERNDHRAGVKRLFALFAALAIDVIERASEQVLLFSMSALASGAHVEQGREDGGEGHEKTNAPIHEEQDGRIL